MKSRLNARIAHVRNFYVLFGLIGTAALVTSCRAKSTTSLDGELDRDHPIGEVSLESDRLDECPKSSPLRSPCLCDRAVYRSGFCCEEGFSFSQCTTKERYVRPRGGGAKDGLDWANALSGLPAVLERDTLYWVSAGNYPGYTFDDRTIRQLGITVRKATPDEHGGDVGWNPDYARGQAVFGPLRFKGDGYTIDGGEPNGIKTVGQMGTRATVQVDGSHIVLRRIEIDGGLLKTDNRQIAGGCNGSNVEGNHIAFDRCEIHNVADDGMGIYADHVKVVYSKIHDLHGCGTDSHCSGPCYNGHSDGIELNGASHVELVGNMIYDVRSTAAIFMGSRGGHGVSDLVAYNNVFYTPATGLTVYLQGLKGAKVHNNIIWGRTQGNRYGGLAIGKGVTGLEMLNNIILNINYSHLGASHDPKQHRLDYNLFGMINSGEYTANSHDLVVDPKFPGIPMSSHAGDHRGSDVQLEDFRTTVRQVVDRGTIPPGIPARDVIGQERPRGEAWDRGPFESSP